jgi:hypothetical protein
MGQRLLVCFVWRRLEIKSCGERLLGSRLKNPILRKQVVAPAFLNATANERTDF